MQDFKDRLTDMGQFPSDKTGHGAVEWAKFKLIRHAAPSDGSRRQSAFAVHH